MASARQGPKNRDATVRNPGRSFAWSLSFPFLPPQRSGGRPPRAGLETGGYDGRITALWSWVYTTSDTHPATAIGQGLLAATASHGG